MPGTPRNSSNELDELCKNLCPRSKSLVSSIDPKILSKCFRVQKTQKPENWTDVLLILKEGASMPSNRTGAGRLASHAICVPCNEIFAYSGGDGKSSGTSTSITQHLRKESHIANTACHRRFDNDDRPIETPQEKTTAKSHSHIVNGNLKRKENDIHRADIDERKKKQRDDAYFDWVVSEKIAHKDAICCESFKAFVGTLTPSYKMPDEEFMVSRVLAKAHHAKDLIAQRLRDECEHFHLIVLPVKARMDNGLFHTFYSIRISYATKKFERKNFSLAVVDANPFESNRLAEVVNFYELSMEKMVTMLANFPLHFAKPVTLKIKVFPTKEQFEVKLLPNATIADCKNEICSSQRGLDASRLELVHCGKVLKNDCLLIASGIPAGDTVHAASRTVITPTTTAVHSDDPVAARKIDLAHDANDDTTPTGIVTQLSSNDTKQGMNGAGATSSQAQLPPAYLAGKFFVCFIKQVNDIVMTPLVSYFGEALFQSPEIYPKTCVGALSVLQHSTLEEEDTEIVTKVLGFCKDYITTLQLVQLPTLGYATLLIRRLTENINGIDVSSKDPNHNGVKFHHEVMKGLKTNLFVQPNPPFMHSIPLEPKKWRMVGLTDDEKVAAKMELRQHIKTLYAGEDEVEDSHIPESMAGVEGSPGGTGSYDKNNLEYYFWKMRNQSQGGKSKMMADPSMWWEENGDEWPELAKLARQWLSSTATCPTVEPYLFHTPVVASNLEVVSQSIFLFESSNKSTKSTEHTV